MNQFSTGTPFWTTGSEQLASNQDRTAVVKERGVQPKYDTITRANWEVTSKRLIEGGDYEDNNHDAPAPNMVDGNISSMWHSKWENDELCLLS